MKKPEVYLKPVPKDIIELAKDHARMCTEIGNLMYLAHKLSKGEDYTWILNKSSHYPEIDYISTEIRKLYEENKKLKEENIKLQNELKQ